MKKNTRFAVLSILVFLILAVAFLADKIVPYDPLSASLSDAFQAPGKEHYFGTDALGRDVFSRVICGATTSVYSVLILVAVILVVGTFLGIIAGYFGGVADAVIMRVGDMMIAFPDLILAMAIAGILGPSLKNSMIANRGGKLDQIRQTFQKSGAEDTEQDLYIGGGNLRLQTQQNPYEIYAAQRAPHDDHYSGDGYRHHHAVAGKPVLPWFWNSAPYAGMGIYAERGKNLYTEQPVAAVLSGTCGLYYGSHL